MQENEGNFDYAEMCGKMRERVDRVTPPPVGLWGGGVVVDVEVHLL